MIALYLASRFQDLLEVRGVANRLRPQGVNITSRWLRQSPDDNMQALQDRPKDRASFCMQDIEDIMKCDVFVGFSQQQAHGNGTGGRHVELGLALALGKKIILFGERENIFHDHKNVHVVTNEEDILPMALKLYSSGRFWRFVSWLWAKFIGLL